MLFKSLTLILLINFNAYSQDKKIIDYHAHVAGIGSGSDCFISKHLKDSFKYKIYLKAFGVSEKELLKNGDASGFPKYSQKIKESRYVDKAILLALDGIYNDKGQLDKENTQFYVSNDFVSKGVKNYPNLLFGASVNPNRADAMQELEKVTKQGAILIKWIPAIQLIDPSDSKLKPFYLYMKKHNLILLTHTGQERSFLESQDGLGDPLKLELPLSLGVTVIAAHVATTGTVEGELMYNRLLPMFAKYPNLYADISSLTQINKKGYIDKILTDERLKDRLVFGTDFPLINTLLVSPLYYIFDLKLMQVRQLYNIENEWDRDVELKKMLGFDGKIFERRLGRLKLLK